MPVTTSTRNSKGWYVTLYGTDERVPGKYVDVADLDALVTAGTAFKKVVNIYGVYRKRNQTFEEVTMTGGVKIESSAWYEGFRLRVLEATFAESDWDRDDLEEIENICMLKYKFLYNDGDGYPKALHGEEDDVAVAIITQYETEDNDGTAMREATITCTCRYPERV